MVGRVVWVGVWDVVGGCGFVGNVGVCVVVGWLMVEFFCGGWCGVCVVSGLWMIFVGVYYEINRKCEL